ncbi:Pentachlorophenol 4-monooxygenase [Hartmannibacter diazotrophicus]|uniref:Pentachlorophenol 4-monooxygenase n=1 Tax=Hartmannibacter diazotrophicus TaxID=1482074 RepID=A0A2C9D871_9HYPH|nr:FAD-dependent oxidoreductase [Hartmannibacter diazotrophicus]SON56328.1 Pentachlorophenol 4-monooxygenase [Hartmannibacter diazotrophicus]
MPKVKQTRTGCVIAGGGPAGLMAGYLLARQGVDVTVLEKHGDFLRDFRGDTIHPSTLELMQELGVLDRFLKLPHQKVRQISVFFGEEEVPIGDFSHLPVTCPYIAMMPQWDFLDFIAGEAGKLPTFTLLMNAKASDLILQGERVAGVRVETRDEDLEIRADLVVAADGRHSTLRDAAGFVPDELGAPMDVLWMRLPRRESDPDEAFGRVSGRHMLVMINRGDYWQCAWLIDKGGFEAVREQGIGALRAAIAETAPFVADRTGALRDFGDVSLLTVAVNRLKTWHRQGFLCIGDAAHAMSPVGGVGVNLAIQDAVATANLLAKPLKEGYVGNGDLAAVQGRRLFPTVVTQKLQVFLQNRMLGRVLSSGAPVHPPAVMRLLQEFATLRRLPARIVGMGIRPEHIQV